MMSCVIRQSPRQRLINPSLTYGILLILKWKIRAHPIVVTTYNKITQIKRQGWVDRLTLKLITTISKLPYTIWHNLHVIFWSFWYLLNIIIGLFKIVIISYSLSKRVVIFFCDPMCTNAYHDKPAVRVFFYFYALVLLYLLPLGGMAISNTCVIRALIRSSRYTKKLQSMKSLEKGVKYSTTSRSNGEATITDKPIYRNKNGADVTTDGKSTVDSMVTSGSDEDPFPPVAKAKKSKVKSRHSSVAQRQKVRFI